MFLLYSMFAFTEAKDQGAVAHFMSTTYSEGL
jgi:hypothetical protein